MFVELVQSLLITFLVAFIVSSVAGALFAGLTLGSRHVRWALPTVACFTGLVFFQVSLHHMQWKWWQPLVAFVIAAVAIRAFRSLPNADDRPYSDIWCGAVLRSTVILVGFTMTILMSLDPRGMYL